MAEGTERHCNDVINQNRIFTDENAQCKSEHNMTMGGDETDLLTDLLTDSMLQRP